MVQLLNLPEGPVAHLALVLSVPSAEERLLVASFLTDVLAEGEFSLTYRLVPREELRSTVEGLLASVGARHGISRERVARLAHLFSGNVVGDDGEATDQAIPLHMPADSRSQAVAEREIRRLGGRAGDEGPRPVTEGRHRLLAYWELGMPQIPVIEYRLLRPAE